MADASKKVNIGITTTADTAGADKAAKSIENISSVATTASANVVKGSSKMGFAIGNVGNQLQDIAVQAQSGTSAITILAQQGPQLLSGFGPQGAIAGAVLALGGLILSTMIKSTEAAKKAAEDAWEAADEFAQKTQEAFKKAGGEEADALIRKSERIKDLTEQSADAEIDLANQQRERIKAQSELIKSQEDLAVSAIKYLSITGQITDAETQIAAIQNQAREAQKQNAVADIEASVRQSEIRYKTAQTILDDAKREKVQLEESIAMLQKQQQDINRQANIRIAQDKGLVAAGVEKKGFESSEAASLKNQLSKLEGAIAALQRQSDKAPEVIQKALDNVYTTAQAFDMAQKGAAAQIQELETKYNVTESSKALEEGIGKVTAGVSKIKELLPQIEPINQQQLEAKNTLEASVADSKLTAQEMLKNAAALQLLSGTIKAGQDGTLKAVQEMQKVTNQLIASNNALVAEATRQAGIIKTLPAVTR